MHNTKQKTLAALATLLLAVACGPREAQEAETDPRGASKAAAGFEGSPRREPWFLCDAIDQPAVLFAEPPDRSGAVTIMVYSKTGDGVQSDALMLGAKEGAAGSVFQALLRGGRDAGHVRTLNEGMLEDPNDAYTPPIASVRIGAQDYSCRWLARTRFAGFTDRRSVFVTQDADGDLIYQTFDFANAAAQVDFRGGQRSTVFSLEVRDGRESTAPDGQTFAFENNGYRYEISAPNAGEGRLRVLRAGRELQSEPFIAFQTGPT